MLLWTADAVTELHDLGLHAVVFAVTFALNHRAKPLNPKSTLGPPHPKAIPYSATSPISLRLNECEYDMICGADIWDMVVLDTSCRGRSETSKST